ncbi:MAG: ABC transporter ATP-binding protein [candidate division Zixibacteria bacterium]|nr:ABC transporter ATP-binding protein [candidate division Zixibacteria bacterium]
MIRLTDIAKYYTNGSVTTHVLRKINLDFAEGEFVSIMGPSGAGKSTLLNIIGMLDSPSEGRQEFFGEPVHDLSERKRAGLYKEHIGFIFQSYHLIDELTVYENLETPLLYRKVKSGERKSIVCDTLDRFRIVGKKDLFPSQLSGGQQQLVGVARAIIGSPNLLLADEPTGNLHSEHGQEIMELFTRLNKEGTTIIQATHSESNATYGQRTIRLKDGWVESDDRVTTPEPNQSRRQ